MSRPTNEKKLRRAKRKNPATSSKKRKYNRWERDAMGYHKVVMKAVAEGNITEEQGKLELDNASKEAGANLRSQGAPEQLANVVEQLIIYGSYDAMVAELKAIKEGS
jgi:hypothetical protein